MKQMQPTIVETVDPVIKNSAVLKDYGKEVKGALHDLVLQGGEQSRSIADLLHGVWLGHPLHPLLTDVTIGAWSFAALFDALSIVMPFRRSTRDTADALTTLGIVTAIPTTAAGLTDYSTIKQDAVQYGFLHGILNVTGLMLYLLSRRARSHNHRLTGIWFSLLGLATLTAASWLGGEMVYRQRVGVSHAIEPSKPEDWQAILAFDDLVDRQPQRVDVEGQPVLLYREGDAVYAISAVCAHAGGPLEEGDVADGCVECPWHNSVFDLRTGSVVHGPATYEQPAYDVRVTDGQIEIRVKPSAG